MSHRAAVIVALLCSEDVDLGRLEELMRAYNARVAEPLQVGESTWPLGALTPRLGKPGQQLPMAIGPVALEGFRGRVGAAALALVWS